MPAPHRPRTAVSHWLVAIPLVAAGCFHAVREEDAPAAAATTRQRTPTFAPCARAAASSAGESDQERRRSAEIADNLRRGQLEVEHGRFNQAARFFERVLRDDPQNVVAHHRLAIVSDRCCDFTTAEEHYLAALELRPADADLLNDLGYSYLLQQRLPESERALRNAISADPAHELAINNLGLLYRTLGDEDRAAAVLRLFASEADVHDRLAILTPRHSRPVQDKRVQELPTQTAATSPADDPIANQTASLLPGSPSISVSKSAAPPGETPRVAANTSRRPGLIEPRLQSTNRVVGQRVDRAPSQAYVRQDRRSDDALRVTGSGEGARLVTADIANESAGRIDPRVRDLPLWTAPAASDNGLAGGTGSAVLPAGWLEENPRRQPTGTAPPVGQLPPPLFAAAPQAIEPDRTARREGRQLPLVGHSVPIPSVTAQLPANGSPSARTGH